VTINSIEGVLRVLDAVGVELAAALHNPATPWAETERHPSIKRLNAARTYLATLTPPAADPAQGAQPVAWLEPETGNSAWPEDMARCRQTHPEDYTEWFPVYTHPAPQAESQLRARLEKAMSETDDGSPALFLKNELRATLATPPAEKGEGA
jgi:hypothetical protein